MARAFVEGLGWVEKQTAVVEIDEPGTYSITPDRGKVFDAVKVSVNINLDDYVKKTELENIEAALDEIIEMQREITFTIKHNDILTTYKALEDMTWAEWCGKPEYNTDGFMPTTFGVVKDFDYIHLGETQVRPSEVIEAGCEYTAK